MEKGYEVRNGLVVPVEKKEPRKIAQLVAAGPDLFARADDGTVWMFWSGSHTWEQLPDLPNG